MFEKKRGKKARHRYKQTYLINQSQQGTYMRGFNSGSDPNKSNFDTNTKRTEGPNQPNLASSPVLLTPFVFTSFVFQKGTPSNSQNKFHRKHRKVKFTPWVAVHLGLGPCSNLPPSLHLLPPTRDSQALMSIHGDYNQGRI